MNHSQENKSAYLYMLAGALAFACMSAMSRAAGERVAWQLVAVARTAVAFVLALAVARGAGVRLVFWRPKTLWLRSLAGSTGLLCCFYALTHLPLSDTITLMNTSPLWVTLLGWMVFKQRPKPAVLLAMGLALAGVALIQQPHFRGEKFACLMALLNGFFTAVAMLGLNRLRGVDPRAVVTHFSGVSTVATLLFLWATGAAGSFTQVTGAGTWALLLGVGAAGMLGQMGMTLAFARGPAARVSVVALAQILFGLAFDVVLWQRQLNAVSLAGMVLVAAPMAWLLLGRTREEAMPAAETSLA